MSIQTPKAITTLGESRAHRPTPPVSSATKKLVFGKEFLLNSTYEILDRGNSPICQFHKEFQHRTGINAKTGMFIPFSVTRGDDSTANNPQLVQTDVDSNIRLSFVNSPICSKATIVTGLVGNYSRPYFATSATPLSSPAEGSTVADNSNQTLGPLTLKPAALAFNVPVSYELVKQSQANIIESVFNDVNRVALSNLDEFAPGPITASGNVPSKGILNSSVNPSSGNADFSKTNFYTTDLSSAITNVKLSSAVANVEATAAHDDGAFLFFTSPPGASSLRTTPIGGVNNRFFVENNRVLGDDRLPLATSQYLNGVSGNLIFGRFSDLALAIWGFEIAVDPYTQMTQGNIVLNCVLWCNVGLLHGPSFVVGTAGNL